MDFFADIQTRLQYPSSPEIDSKISQCVRTTRHLQNAGLGSIQGIPSASPELTGFITSLHEKIAEESFRSIFKDEAKTVVLFSRSNLLKRKDLCFSCLRLGLIRHRRSKKPHTFSSKSSPRISRGDTSSPPAHSLEIIDTSVTRVTNNYISPFNCGKLEKKGVRILNFYDTL
jgi:hypothetical protein